MLERLGFEELVNGHSGKAHPARHDHLSFVLGMVLAIYVGFARLNHLRFVARDPMQAGILKVSELPGQERLLAVSGLR